MNIPNILTITRILLIPVFVICLQKSQYTPALLIFTAAGITDALDGLIARCFDQKTVLGAYLDPIADKLLLTCSFITLSILGTIPQWLAVIVISRDILIVLGIGVCSVAGIDFEIKPTIISKCTTFLQLLTIFFSLLRHEMPSVSLFQYIFILVWLTAAFTVTSGLHYIYKGLSLLQEDAE